MRIGIDFGGVLSKSDEKNNYNTSLDMPGALEALLFLKKQGHTLFLISFAGRQRSLDTRMSINKTCPGLFDQMFFVKEKSLKALVVKMLGIHVMIDDLNENLQEVARVNPFCKTILFENWDKTLRILSTFVPADVDPNTDPELERKIKLY